MCELRPNLVAWLDGELSPEEAAVVAGHIESCAVCRSQTDAIRRASQALRIYCESALAEKSRPNVSRVIPLLAAASVIAAAGLFLAYTRHRVAPVAPAAAIPVVATIPSPDASIAPSTTPRTASVVQHKSHRKRQAVSVPVPVPWPSADTAVEIAIPADAMFAPGALPQGTRFLAEMRIAPDGTVRQVRLRQ